jgi:hypothetical protein
MVLGVKTRLVLAGAVLGASLMALATANAQMDPTGSPTTTTPVPGVPQTTPGVSPTPGTTGTTPGVPQPDLSGLNADAGIGGSGSMMPPSTYPSPFDRDAGFGGSGLGSGFSPPPSFGGQDAGTGLGF